MIARRTPAATLLVLALALGGCELVAGIKDRPLADDGGAGAATGAAGAGGGVGGTTGTAGASGRGGAAGSGSAGQGGSGGAAGNGGAAGSTTGGAGRGGASATAGTTGTAGASGTAGAAGAAGTAGTGAGGGAGAAGTAGTGAGGSTGGAAGRGGANGGAGAGGRGGAAGSTGGSSAGSGGSGGSLSFVCPAIAASQLAIADLETGPAINTQLISTTTFFPSSPGVEVSFNGIVSGTGSLTRVNDAHGGAAAINFGVTGSGTRSGTLYMRFNPATGTPPGAKAACVDASHFTGIRFWAKGPASVDLNVYTPQPTSEVGTISHSASTRFGVNNQWQLIEIRWDEMQQSMIQFPFDPAGIWFITFGLSALQDVSLTLDDVTFIP